MAETARVRVMQSDAQAVIVDLLPVFARASSGDYSQDVQRPSDPRWAPLFDGVQALVEAAREKTQEQERLQREFRSIVEHAPNFIHIIDLDLRVIFINRGNVAHPVHSLIGTRVGDFLSPLERRRVRRRLRKVISTGRPAQYEFQGPGDDGAGWYRQNAGPIWEKGVVTGLVLITHDITHDRNRAAALEEGKRRAEAARAYDQVLLSSIGEGLIVVNDHGEIANINPYGASMLGYKPDEMIGEWFPRMIRAVADNGLELDPLERPALKALSSGKVISQSLHYQRRDGSVFPVAVTISPIVLEGKPVGAVEVFRDLSRERQLDQAKEEFVSLASHQLRTPATGVKAYISMLLDGYAGEVTTQQRSFLSKVYESNERQLQIVNDMLSVARADAGRIVPEMSSTDLNQLLKDIIDEQRPIIRGHKQSLSVSLPKFRVEAVVDPKLIRMVGENIISNASKYTPQGGNIDVQLNQFNKHATITVKDTGVGIAKSDLTKLFKRFSRIDNPLSTQRGGSGLGLYLTNTIVLLHNGRISVDSILNEGTTFIIELPLNDSTTEGSEL